MMTPLSPTTLVRHLEEMIPDVAWVDLRALAGDQAVACVDGRNHDCVAATPGGNAGLFVLLLGALEAALARTLTDSDVEALFDAYLDRFGLFYLHSDTHAVDLLCDHLAAASLSGALPESRQEQAAFLRSPPASLRPPILEVFGDPPFIGCGHLRLVAAHPGTYRVRERLLRTFLRAFIQRVWQGDERCAFDVLIGPHTEQAVVRMHGRQHTLPPLPHPHYDRRQLFVYHPEVTAFMEGEHLRFLADHGWLAPPDVPRFHRTQHALAADHLATTLSLLAPDLPVFDVEWTAEGVRLIDR
jgi:hypothetical protein